MPPAYAKPYMTPAELLKRLPDLGKTTIYRELNSGNIPSIRIGRKFLIPNAAFDKWLAECGGALVGSRPVV